MKVLLSKKTLLLFLFLSISIKSNLLFAQQDPQYTNYMYNPSAINPAFAGFRNTLSATFIHRSQWLGVDGAPTTDALSIHSPLENDKIAVGANITNDAIGPTNKMSFNGDFAYTIFTENSNLSFGAKVGVQRYSLNNNKIRLQDYSDPDFLNFENTISPQVGFGFMFETTNLNVGVSVPNVIEKDYSKAGSNSIYKANDRRNYYGFVGYIFNLSSNTILKTTALSKMTVGAPIQVDVSANFLFYQKLTLGVGYRPNAAVSGLLGYQISDSFMIGCAYDRDITTFTNVNSGSAEFVLRYEFLNKISNNRILNPRIF